MGSVFQSECSSMERLTAVSINYGKTGRLSTVTADGESVPVSMFQYGKANGCKC